MQITLTVFGPQGGSIPVDSMNVSQREGMHDAFTCHLSGLDLRDPDDIKGAACRLSWSVDATRRSVVGYVDTTALLDGDDGIGGVAVLALGATSVMRSGQSRVWSKSTPFRIAKNVVAPYRVSLIADQHDIVLDSFMQSGESDWAVLNRLAGESGMTVVPSGTTVQMIDVNRAMGRSSSQLSRALSNPDTFTVMETPTPIGYESYEFSGIDALGQNFTVRGGPKNGIKRHAGEHFSSLAAAKNAVSRKVDRQRQYIKATATYKGDRDVSCGDIVVASGQRWFVASMEVSAHRSNGRIQTALELHRPPSFRPVSRSIGSPPESILREGRWLSARRYQVEL